MQCASGPVSKTVLPLQGTEISDAAYRGFKKKKKLEAGDGIILSKTKEHLTVPKSEGARKDSSLQAEK